MSGWYNEGRRHYGPKPNTRRARGLKRRDAGKPKKVSVKVPNNMPKERLLRFMAIYQMYCAAFEEFMDENLAMEYVKRNFHPKQRVRSINCAIRVINQFRKDNNI